MIADVVGERARRGAVIVVVSAISYVETWSTTSRLPAVFGGSAFACALVFTALGWTGRRRRS